MEKLTVFPKIVRKFCKLRYLYNDKCINVHINLHETVLQINADKLTSELLAYKVQLCRQRKKFMKLNVILAHLGACGLLLNRCSVVHVLHSQFVYRTQT